MPSEIDVKINLNTQDAMKDLNTFSSGVKEKVTELNQLQTGIGDTTTWVNLHKKNFFPDADYSGLTGSLDVANKTIEKMKDGLAAIETMLGKNRLSQDMVSSFRSVYQTITTSMEQYSKALNKISKDSFSKFERVNRAAIESQLRQASATGLRASEDATTLANILLGKDKSHGTGLSTKDFGRMFPALKMIADREIRSAQRTLKGTGGLEDLTTALASSDVFKDTYLSLSGRRNTSEQQMRNLAKAMVLATNRLVVNDKGKAWQTAGITPKTMTLVTDALPEAYREAYRTYGKSGEARTNWSTGKLLPDKTRTPNDNLAYANFRRLVNNGNIQAARLGIKTGLVRAENGRYVFSGRPSSSQLQGLATLATMSIADAKTSLPFHHLNRNSIEDEQKAIARQNKLYDADMEIIEALAKAGVAPASLEKVRSSFGFVKGTDKQFAKVNKNPHKIRTLGNATQFVIPSTTFDEKGNVIVRDKSWIKENGAQEKPDDHFIAIGQSTVTRLLGMHGNNTYGYGRDEEGNAVYKSPKLIKLNVGDIIEQKKIKQGNKTKLVHAIKEDRMKDAERLNRIYNRQELVNYDGEDYIAAYADASGIYMARKKEVDTIEALYKKRGYASPFNNMDVTAPANFAKGMKAVDVSKKKATPGVLYQTLGYKDLPNFAMVDFETWGKYAGLKDKDSFMRQMELIDGLALFDPTVLGVNAQMRAGSGNTKFMGQVENWRKLLSESKVLEKAYNSGKHRGMISLSPKDANGKFINPSGYSLYMPQIGLEQNFVNSLYDEMDKLAGSVDPNDAAKLKKLRDTYFFDIMDEKYGALMTESAIKGQDKFRVVTKEMFENQKRGAKDKSIWAAPAKIREDGLYELTAQQQSKYFQGATKIGGLWVNKTAADFSRDKDFIPESVATSIGLSHAERIESEKNYENEIYALQHDENARLRELEKTAAGRMLISAGDIQGSLANALIGNRIKALEQSRGLKHVYLPGRGNENRLTGVLQGSPFGKALYNLTGARAEGIYAPLFQYDDKEARVLMKTIRDDQSLTNAATRLTLGRNPNAPGEYGVNIKNIGDFRSIRQALDQIGAEYDDTIYTDPTLQFQLMTGDYDGDTAWVLRSLSGATLQNMQRYKEKMQEARTTLRARFGKQPEPEAKPLNKDSQFMDFVLAHHNAQLIMGQTTAGIRNIMEGYDLEDPNAWMALAELIDAYDRGTSEAMKTGEVINLSDLGASAASQGSVFRRFVRQIYALGNGNEDADPDIFRTRMPLGSEKTELAAVAANFARRRKGENVNEGFAGSLNTFLENKYGYSSPEAKAAWSYGEMFNRIAQGFRLPDVRDISQARMLAIKWGQDIDTKASAGIDTSEDASRLRAFLTRLDQLESRGLTKENNEKRIGAIKSRMEEMRKAGASPIDEEWIELQNELTLREIANRPLSKELETANTAWDAHVAALSEKARKKYEENLSMVGPTTEGGKFRGKLNKILEANPEALASMSWSSVYPWFYQEYMKDVSGGAKYGLPVSAVDLRTGEIQKGVGSAFFGLKENDATIAEKQRRQMARELDRYLGDDHILPEADLSVESVFGNLRHESLAKYALETMHGRKGTRASDYFVAAVSQAIDNGASDLKQLNLNIANNEGALVFGEGAYDTKAEELYKMAAGTYNPNTKHFEGGMLDLFTNAVIDRTLSSGGRIVNVEGTNYEYGANGVRALNNVSKYGERVTLDNITYTQTTPEGGKGLDVAKTANFAPDLIMADANNRFSMYDYKPNQKGGFDALYQMMVYAKDIQRKAAQDKKAGVDNGWGQFVDKNGNLLFDQFVAYDAATGQNIIFKPKDVQGAVDMVDEINTRAQKAKMAAAKDGTFMREGYKYLEEELKKRYGDGEFSYVARRPVEDIIMNTGALGKVSDSYKSFVVEKFGRDQETLGEINSFVHKQERKNANLSGHGFSQFKMYRDQLEGSLDNAMISSMMRSLEADTTMEPEEKSAALAELKKVQLQKIDLRNRLNQQELLATTNGFNDVDNFIQQVAYGTRRSSTLDAFSSIRNQINNQAAIREGLMTNPAYYEGNDWKNEAAKNAYYESIERQKETESLFAKVIPSITDTELAKNNATLRHLSPTQGELSLEEKVHEAYTAQIDRIQQYIQQQDKNIADFDKELTRRDEVTKEPVLKEGSAERAAFEKLKANAEANKAKALELINDTSLKNYITENIGSQKQFEEDKLADINTQLEIRGRNFHQNPFGVRRDIGARIQYTRNSAIQNAITYREGIAQQIMAEEKHAYKEGSPEYKDQQARLKELRKEYSSVSSAIETLNGPLGTVGASFAQFGEIIGRVAQRLGRRLFMKALQETKKFILDFNKQMTSIQMITLKTDEQMSTLGDGLIAKAQELKVSISEIASSAETLYRQGLSDEEVNERLEVISKFSKVSGTKIDAATKLVTVAMNTGLVTSPEVAADIVTALGDSAATNAAEIEKGIEKAGAAAAADGTTFAQLASMLTAITSTTQIGGNVAGRTLNTIFGRMNKIGTNELIFDENGNAVSGSAVAKLLKSVGVETYINGQKRSSYDVLYDLSQRWDDLSDAEQQQLANQIAGTRQYSNFAAIMQGMAEGKVDKYMSLTEESGGIVDRKYEIYTQSLEAALVGVKNAWDALIADLTEKGTLTGVLETVTNIINGVNNWADSLGGLGAAIAAVLPMLVAFASIKAAIMSGSIPGLIVGLTAGLIGVGVLSALNSSGKSSGNNFESSLSAYDSYTTKSNASLSELKTLKEKGNERTAEENAQYESLINTYSVKFGLVSSAAQNATSGIDTLSGSIKTLGSTADEQAKKIIDNADQEQKNAWALLVNGANKRNEMMDQITSNLVSGAEEYEKEVSFRNPLLASIWHVDEETGTPVLSSGAAYSFIGAKNDSRTRDIVKSLFSGAGKQGWLEEWFPDFATMSDENWTEAFNKLSVKNLSNKYDGMLSAIMNYAFLGSGSVDQMTEEWASSAFSPVIRPLLERAGYTDGEIEYLLQEVVNKYLDQSSEAIFGDPASYAQAYVLNWLFGSEASWDSITKQINTNLSGYGNKTLGQKVFGLKPATGSDYYINNRNEVVSSSYIDEAAKYSEEINLAAKLMLNKDKQTYQEFLRTNGDLFAGEDLVDEDIETILRNNGQELILGVNKTVEAYVEFLKTGGEMGEDIAAQVNEKSKEFKFKLVSNKFVKAINYGGVGGWLEKNQAGVSADAIVSMLLTGSFGSGASGLTELMRFINNGNGIADWQDALKGNPEISRILNQAVYDSTTASYISAPEDIMDQLIRVIASGSLTYSGKTLNASEKGQLAMAAFTGLQNGMYLTDEQRTRAMEAEWNKLSQEDRRDTTMLEYFSGENYFTGALSPEQETYLREVLGDRMFNTVAEAATRGTLNQLPPEVSSYIEERLGNASAGITSYTAKQNLDHINEVYKNLDKVVSGGYNKDVASEYMSQWSNWNEYISLLGREDLNDNQKERLATLTQEFENIRNNAEIDIRVENVKVLEEAGKVAEGTAAAFEKLAKGGKDAADALNSLRKDAFESGQQRAKLYNGSEYEQMQAAMSILGISEEQFMQDISGNISRARIYTSRYQEPLAIASYEQLYKAAKSAEERRSIIESAAQEGIRIESAASTAITPEQLLKQYHIADELDIPDYLKEASRKGTIQWAKSRGYAYDAEHDRFYDTGLKIYADDSLLNVANPSVGSVYSYKTAQYSENSKAAVAANSLFRALQSGSIQSVSDLSKAVNETDVKNWTELMQSSDEVNKRFKEMGVTVGKDGALDFSGVKLEGDSFASALAALTQTVSQASEAFSKWQELLTPGETYERALNYFNGIGDEETGYAAFSQLMGNDKAAQYIRNQWLDLQAQGYSVDANGYIISRGRTRVTEKDENDRLQYKMWQPLEGLDEFNREYFTSIMTNTQYGSPELSEVQRYYKLMDLIATARQGGTGIYDLRTNDLFGAFNAYTEGVSGAGDWLQATEILAKNKMTWADVAEGVELPEEFVGKNGVYATIEAAVAANDEFNKSLVQTAYNLKSAGKFTGEYDNGLKVTSKDIKTANDAAKSFRSTLMSISNNQYLRNEFKKGNKNATGLKEYVQSLGFSEKDLKDKNMQQMILDAMSADEEVDMTSLSTALDGAIDGLTEKINAYVASKDIVIQGAKIGIEEGTVEVSTAELINEFGSIIDQQVQNLIDIALASGAEIEWLINWKDQEVDITPVVKKLGAKRSGGGGGGGKSKTDKLLEAQKHRIEAIQHENNMLEIEAEDYARANNISGYESTVDKQIDGQEKLRAAYKQNIAEIKQQMNSVKKESDDWYKLVEALYSAEEAYAKITSAIDELIKKQIQERQQLYEFESANNSHSKNMLDIWKARYTRYNDYTKMGTNIDEQVANARAQVALDTAWANDLAAKIQDQYDHGTGDNDTVREWRQTLDQLLEKIANSTEEIAELEASRLNIIQQERTNNLQTPEHFSRMYDINREMMNLDKNYSGLINSYDNEYANTYEQYQIWSRSREQMLNLLSTQDFDTTEWYNTRAEIYAADEQLKQLELQMKQAQNNKIAEQLNYFTTRSDYESGNRQHNLNMIQSEEQRYQTLNELTNYGYMLDHEQEVHRENISAAEEELVLLNKTREALEEQGLAGTENYLNVIELIKQREELIKSETATIEQNTQKLKENAEAILKTRQDLENTLDAEFKAREEQRKKELSARVSLENTILETIKDRYRDEWRLIQEDINKKKEALAKEKSLIAERLNARKQAASQEEKYSELEELRRQQALLASDPTRSKDFKAVTEKITKLEQELSMEEASQEAQASMQTIEDEIQALAEEESYGSQQLSEMLEDANNFSEQVEEIINSSWDNIAAYLTENNKAFRNSLEDGQQQMLEGWEQTWKNMKGMVDTYWTEINEILTSPESFLAYMMASRTYEYASDVGRELLVMAWQNMMDKYTSAYTSSPEAQYYQTDEHPWYEGSGEYGGYNDYSGIGQNGIYGTPENGVNMPVDNGQTIFPEQPTTSSGSSNGNGNGKGGYYIAQGIVNTETVDENGLVSYDYVLHADKTTRDIAYAVKKVKDKFIQDGFKESQIQIVVRESTTKDKYDEWGVFKQGGLVNYTGPAWVDGTPSKPEAFLNASQTETFKKLADAMTKISISGGIWPDGDMFGGGDTNYGDIYVTINQAELKDDADFDEVAKKVGKSFVKEMSRNGFNLTKYNL